MCTNVAEDISTSGRTHVDYQQILDGISQSSSTSSIRRMEDVTFDFFIDFTDSDPCDPPGARLGLTACYAFRRGTKEPMLLPGMAIHGSKAEAKLIAPHKQCQRKSRE